jgi:hypothetical protein
MSLEHNLITDLRRSSSKLERSRVNFTLAFDEDKFLPIDEGSDIIESCLECLHNNDDHLKGSVTFSSGNIYYIGPCCILSQAYEYERGCNCEMATDHLYSSSSCWFFDGLTFKEQFQLYCTWEMKSKEECRLLIMNGLLDLVQYYEEECLEEDTEDNRHSIHLWQNEAVNFDQMYERDFVTD